MQICLNSVLFITLPFPGLQFQSGNSSLPPETLPPPESSRHHTHELTFLPWGQSHGPLTIKSQLSEEKEKQDHKCVKSLPN